jgi:hypothetical protein
MQLTPEQAAQRRRDSYWNTDHLPDSGGWGWAILGLVFAVGVLGVAAYWIWAWLSVLV